MLASRWDDPCEGGEGRGMKTDRFGVVPPDGRSVREFLAAAVRQEKRMRLVRLGAIQGRACVDCNGGMGCKVEKRHWGSCWAPWGAIAVIEERAEG